MSDELLRDCLVLRDKVASLEQSVKMLKRENTHLRNFAQVANASADCEDEGNFWVIYEAASFPIERIATPEEAHTEAERLCKETGKTLYVLRAVSRVRRAEPVVVTQRLLPKKRVDVSA